ncbi:hypothetical protein I307_02576 [Cryptococcus deuterogattii 99/473]|uniref:Uncharacterized protein n=2 Tax=Cryptococcus deuterogattii TaxID=1859096 RepID=A0A0D0V4F1_9TREE|nr:hypothetical protein CNBG_3824 [Cryptococcus deuterogattii R265]KIR28014.1 hypothetical protein I309_03009 [Cryptococcus deuterogattii LA55]KIR39810.1 hypothetical protein I313_04283 [Cryptococcus deuterogattii Ram5]KIR70640.1 hypothetical protein I310_05489 [Cryptococcus deuterogattii CA1014]KIR90780.1 hypothetical protein I304_05431 [Cryptococcus deuterogattii CBS 10090]KIR97479.1 hypothetical protein L804_05164 [Cryptococcus deuterogattii 2001/935-1]KIY57902.1 hypothetical protein I307_
MPVLPHLSRLSLSTSTCSRRSLRVAGQSRSLSLIPSSSSSSVPFFVPHFGSASKTGVYPAPGGKGKDRELFRGGRGFDPEEEVDDREWDMRVARAMIHLQETLPHFFNAEMTAATMLPPDIYSQNMVLKLPAPLPLKISSLSGYSMAFSLTRNGMQALHTGLRSELERMTFSPSSQDMRQEFRKAAVLHAEKGFPSHRMKQIRVLVSVYGTLRLPPHKEAKWHTSSLYTFSPTSGLIVSHEVETIRPLPGEGVAEWMMSRLLGWTSRNAGHEGAIPCPRTVALPPEHRVVRFRKEREEKREE